MTGAYKAADLILQLDSPPTQRHMPPASEVRIVSACGGEVALGTAMLAQGGHHVDSNAVRIQVKVDLPDPNALQVQ